MPSEENNHNKPLTRQERKNLRSSRQERKKEREQQTQSPVETESNKVKKPKKTKKYRKRLLPIWLRLILVLIFCGLALMFGLMVGYGVIGSGDPSDALNRSTWQHIIDIVKQD